MFDCSKENWARIHYLAALATQRIGKTLFIIPIHISRFETTSLINMRKEVNNMIFRNCNFFLLPSQILREVQAIRDVVDTINQNLEASMLDLNALRAEITENSDAVASAVTLITALVDELRAAAGDQVAIDAIVNQLDSQTAALAAAVAANTPAEPPVEPVVE